MQESTEANCRFNIIQPGSSVATALSEGESKKKHVVLLEIMGEQYRTTNQALETVRPFAHESVSSFLRQYLLHQEWSEPTSTTDWLGGLSIGMCACPTWVACMSHMGCVHAPHSS